MLKKTAFTAIMCGTALSAHAQSSVTLFGLIDEGFGYTNNVAGSKVYEMQSGFVQGSRWGKGFGGSRVGLSAIFKLENGFNVNNGKLGRADSSLAGKRMSD